MSYPGHHSMILGNSLLDNVIPGEYLDEDDIERFSDEYGR